MEETIDLIYVRFDKNLDYKAIVNSFPIKKFCESVYGDFPKFLTPTKFEFDREQLAAFTQEQYDLSSDYINESRKIPHTITESYYAGTTGPDLTMEDFEPDVLTDDHFVTINAGDKCLGIITAVYDFDKIVNFLKNK